MRNETVAIPGAVMVTGANGYRMLARNVSINLKERQLTGSGGVSGALNLGQFSANQMFADLDARIVRLQGNARLRINQGVVK